MLGFRTPRWKLIKVPRDDERNFFDLRNDPGELHPLRDAPAEGLPERLPKDLMEAEERTNELLDVGRNEPDMEGLTAEQIERLQTILDTDLDAFTTVVHELGIPVIAT